MADNPDVFVTNSGAPAKLILQKPAHIVSSLSVLRWVGRERRQTVKYCFTKYKASGSCDFLALRD